MNNTIAQILKESSQRLKENISDRKKFLERNKENNWLLSNLIGLSPSEMLLKSDMVVETGIYKKYKNCLERREKWKEPLQYLIGKAFFMDFELEVNKHVLIPRPETETLVEIINSTMSETQSTVLDVGTGSGAIAIALKRAHPAWSVYASDISPKALNLAKRNASLLGLENEILFKQGDLLKPWLKERKNIQLIVANLPYIDINKEYISEEVLKWEPSIALYSKRRKAISSHAGTWEADTLLEQFFEHSFVAKRIALELSEEVATIIKKTWRAHPKIAKIDQLPDLSGKKRFLLIKRK